MLCSKIVVNVLRYTGKVLSRTFMGVSWWLRGRGCELMNMQNSTIRRRLLLAFSQHLSRLSESGKNYLQDSWLLRGRGEKPEGSMLAGIQLAQSLQALLL